MQVIIGTSRRMARWIKTVIPEESQSEERLTALIALKLNNYGVVAFVITMGLLLGKPVETIIGTIGFVVLRIMTGGAHLKSLDACFVVSSAILITIPHIPLNWIMIAILNFSSISIVFWKVESKKHPIVLIALNFILFSSAAGLAFFIQALTLINIRR